MNCGHSVRFAGLFTLAVTVASAVSYIVIRVALLGLTTAADVNRGVQAVVDVQPEPVVRTDSGASRERKSARTSRVEKIVPASFDAPPLVSNHFGAVPFPLSESPGRAQSAILTLRAAQAVILNNIANANTIGFKRLRVNFEDAGYVHRAVPGTVDMQNQMAPASESLGLGVHLQSTQLDISQGDLEDTNEPLDLAIVGEGFFQISDGQNFLYTRAGNFALNANGQMVIASHDRGRPLDPAIIIPPDALQIVINSYGTVNVTKPGGSDVTQIGAMQIARFSNPQGLTPMGGNLYAASPAAGIPQLTSPGQSSLGIVRQYRRERSNVNLDVELNDWRRIEAQLRVFQDICRPMPVARVQRGDD